MSCTLGVRSPMAASLGRRWPTARISSTRANVLADTSPVELLPLHIRQLSVSGHEDRISPPALGSAWARKARAAGDDASVEIVLDTGHVELVSPGTKAWDIEAAALLDMLR